MSTHLLISQMVTEPTRGDSILDLIMCNDDRLISVVSCEETELSDHTMVKALMSFNPGTWEKTQLSYLGEMSFRSLDFNGADFDILDARLSAIDWEKLRDSATFEKFPAQFTSKVLDICLESVPRKQLPSVWTFAWRMFHVNSHLQGNLRCTTH